MRQYTLAALKSMASGNQLDSQRKERWPHHDKVVAPGEPAPGLKVSFDPYEENSDFSDTEGVLNETQFGVSQIRV